MALQQWDKVIPDLALPGTPPPPGTVVTGPLFVVVLGAQFASVQYVARSGTWTGGESVTARLQGTNVPPDDDDHAASWEDVPGSAAAIKTGDAARYAGNGDVVFILPYRYLRMVLDGGSEPPDDAVIGGFVKSVFEIGA